MTDQEAIEHLRRCRRFLVSSTTDVLDEVPDAIDIAIRAIDEKNLVRSKRMGLEARMAGNIAAGLIPHDGMLYNDQAERIARSSVLVARAILAELSKVPT